MGPTPVGALSGGRDEDLDGVVERAGAPPYLGDARAASSGEVGEQDEHEEEEEESEGGEAARGGGGGREG